MSEHKKWTPPYSILAEKKATKPGCWNVNLVTVLGPDGPVGSYEYGYSGKPPFFPFELKGQWYALYSTDYTASRIMKLPTCEDVWVEKGDQWGFCPVEFYVPARQHLNFGGDRTGKLHGTFDTDPEGFVEPHHDQKNDWTFDPVQYCDFGFVCGCVWGDDSSWKVRFFDLAELDKGKVTYDDRFGYFQLHGKLSLAESVNVWGSFDERGKIRIQLTGGQDFRFDGKADLDEAA